MKYEKLITIINVSCVIVCFVCIWVVWFQTLLDFKNDIFIQIFMSGLISFVCTGMLYSWILGPLINYVLRRRFYKYEDQIITLISFSQESKSTLRVVSVWDKTLSFDIQKDYILYFFNEHLRCNDSIELSEYQIKLLFEAIWGEEHTWTESTRNIHGLKNTRMYKHEFDSLMMMYAIDNLTELQKRIAP